MDEIDSSVEVSLLMVNDIPTLKIVASNPNGIKKIKIWSRWGKVPIIRNYECLKIIEDSITPYPTDWFPIVIDVTDCQNEKINRLGSFNIDGGEAIGIIETEDIDKPPGSYRQM